MDTKVPQETLRKTVIDHVEPEFVVFFVVFFVDFVTLPLTFSVLNPTCAVSMELSVTDKLLLRQFFARRPIRRAYMFGSYARHEAIQNSDIDILVELDHRKPIEMKFFTYQLELEDLLKKRLIS